MADLARLNQELQHELALIINREAEVRDTLLTVTYVKCSDDLKTATIGISVLPEGQSGSALTALRKKAKLMAEALEKRAHLRRVPRLRFVIDATEVRAAEVEAAIKEDEEDLNLYAHL